MGGGGDAVRPVGLQRARHPQEGADADPVRHVQDAHDRRHHLADTGGFTGQCRVKQGSLCVVDLGLCVYYYEVLCVLPGYV